MYTEQDIAAAVAHGILGSDDAAALRAQAAPSQPVPPAEAGLRLESRFNDACVAMACLLLLVAMNWLGRTLAPWCVGLLMMLPAWGLAELLTRQRRMALPDMVLMLGLVCGASHLGIALLPSVHGFAPAMNAEQGQLLEYVLSALPGMLAAYAHWRRFRLPLTVAVVCALALTLLLCLLLLALPQARAWLNAIALLAGSAVFALALCVDHRERLRPGRYGNVAFWLYLLAAPLLLHPAFIPFADGTLTLAQTIQVLLLYLAVLLLSLCVDRRALVIVALGYVQYTFQLHLKPFYALVLLSILLGGLLLLLSLFWPSCRAALLRCLPSALRACLPPPAIP